MKTDIPVIRTKIIIPQRRREIISRPRLLNILHDILELKLLILAAPAGYGKTSLLVDFSKHTQLPMCWLALDPLDNDLKRFTTHLIASIHHRFNEFGTDSFSVLANMNQDSADIDPIVSAIVNDAYDHISEHFVVVLDDYHLVRESKEVEAFINRVILEIGENVHFIIASRTLLTLPDLSLLVARSQVGGLSFEELAFLPDEIKQLLETNYHQEATDAKIKELLDQTEGWITGLLLSTQLSQKGVDERQRVAKVSGIGIYEYLAQQVFDRQAQDVREFLLRTSLLEEFDAAMCEKMLAPVEERSKSYWQDLIDRVLNDNLFVVQVGESTVYLRFHHLFRDFLQNRVRLERPEETEKIEKTLAAYLEEIREWERAYAIYARLNDLEHIADLIHEAGPDLIAGGRLVTLSTWLDELRPDMFRESPELLSLRGAVTLIRGDLKQSLEYFDLAVERLRGGAAIDLIDSYNRRSAALRQLGNYSAAMEDAENAIRLSKDKPDFVLQLAEALRSKGILLITQGQPQEAMTLLVEAVSIYRKLGREMDEARVLFDLGLAHRQIGQFEETEKAYTTALKVIQKSGNALMSANLYNNLGVLQYLLGEYDKAAFSLDKALQYASTSGYPRVEAYILNSIGDLYRDLGAIQQARAAYSHSWDMIRTTPDQSLALYQYLSQSVLERVTGNFDAAFENLRQANEITKSKDASFENALCGLEAAALAIHQGRYTETDTLLPRLFEVFRQNGRMLESDKCDLLFLVSSIGLKSKTKVRKIINRLFASPFAVTSRQALFILGIEFKEFLTLCREQIVDNKLFAEYMANIDDLERQLPEMRKVLRGKTSLVADAPAHIVVRTLGKVQVKVGDRAVTTANWKTQTSRDFFLFLLAHPEGATKEEIAEIFWPFGSAETIRLRFKNTIYRVRRAVGADCISYIDDYYRFNRSVDYEYDAEDFMAALSEANASDMAPDQIKHLKAAINTYRGIFLPKLDLEWALVQRTQMQHAFMDAVIKLANLYFQADQYQQAIHTANRALVEDPCNEAAYRLIMLANAAVGSRAEVARQFDKCKRILAEELNVEPAQQTRALFEMLMR